jgi:hypothetical protein
LGTARLRTLLEFDPEFAVELLSEWEPTRPGAAASIYKALVRSIVQSPIFGGEGPLSRKKLVESVPQGEFLAIAISADPMRAAEIVSTHTPNESSATFKRTLIEACLRACSHRPAVFPVLHRTLPDELRPAFTRLALRNEKLLLDTSVPLSLLTALYREEFERFSKKSYRARHAQRFEVLVDTLAKVFESTVMSEPTERAWAATSELLRAVPMKAIYTGARSTWRLIGGIAASIRHFSVPCDSECFREMTRFLSDSQSSRTGFRLSIVPGSLHTIRTTKRPIPRRRSWRSIFPGPKTFGP